MIINKSQREIGAEPAGKLSLAANSTNSARGLSKYPRTGAPRSSAAWRTGTNCFSDPAAPSDLLRQKGTLFPRISQKYIV